MPFFVGGSSDSGSSDGEDARDQDNTPAPSTGHFLGSYEASSRSYAIYDNETTTGLHRKALVLKEGVLQKGASYILQVVATDTGMLY